VALIQFVILCLVLPNLLFPFVIASENFWTELKPMPTPRSFFGVAVVNEKIYAIGGGVTLSALDSNEEYNPNTDEWIPKKPMPTPRSNFAIAVFQNKIYTFGGDKRAGGISDLTSVTEVYDPLTDIWESKASMPIVKGYFSANVIGNKIYILSGLTQSTPNETLALSSENIVYDPSTDSWTTKAAIPIATHSYVSAVVDNKIYVISGSSVGVTQIYDPKTDTWSDGEPIPTVVQNAAGAATTGTFAPKAIYVFGGFVEFLWSLNLTQIYHPENNTWSSGTDMLASRYGLRAAEMNDTLFVMGGTAGQILPPTNLNEKYVPIGYIPEFPSWIILPLFLSATFSAIMIKKKLLPEGS